MIKAARLIAGPNGTFSFFNNSTNNKPITQETKSRKKPLKAPVYRQTINSSLMSPPPKLSFPKALSMINETIRISNDMLNPPMMELLRYANLSFSKKRKIS